MMFDRLKMMKQKYLALQQQILQDVKIAQKIEFLKELDYLKEITEIYDQYLVLETELAKITTIISNHAVDDDFLVLLSQEKAALKHKSQILLQKIKNLLLPNDPEDQKNVIIQIKGAAGGDEANIFSADLFRMYTKYAELKNWKIEILNLMPSLKKGISVVEFMLSGQRVYSFLKYESGVHRVQRVPLTESQGRIHTSTATVLVMPEAAEIDLKIDWKDIRFDTFNASGPGGQSVNTTKSAVRLTHLPTDIMVSCQVEKSQHENKKKAFHLLKTRIYNQMLKTQENEEHQKRKILIGSGERSEKIRTYNFPQNRLTDHRILLTLKKLDLIMEGKLDYVIEPLINKYHQ